MIDANLFDSRILIVDDNVENIRLIEQILTWAGYTNTQSVSNPLVAMEAFRTFDPDLMLLDLRMPKIDGYQILSEIREAPGTRSFVPILVFTADVTKEARKKALELGASDFLTKPGDPTELLLRVQTFLQTRHLHLALEDQNRELENRVADRTREMEQARLDTLDCLARAAEYRDDVTGEHTRRVGELSAMIAGAMDFDEKTVELIRLAAPLHDIGKIGIPDAILLKPTRLLPLEYEEMKQHVLIGAGILSRGHSPVIRLAHEIALYHHERWDGSGYCSGLAGDSIPASARIVAVADAFDAMTHDRPYHAARSEAEACYRLGNASGSQFHSGAVQAFLDSRGSRDRTHA